VINKQWILFLRSTGINKEIDGLKASRVACENADNRSINLENLPSSITEFDDNVIRQVLRGIRVLEKEKIEILF